jgi:methylmalonyl-CoA mutase
MQKLFSEFSSTSAIEWKNQIIKDLKGEAFENLIWKNENDININPFYSSEDLKQSYDPAFNHTNWDICVHKTNLNSKALNEQLLADLNRGATSISVTSDNIDFELALENIQLNYIHSTFFINEQNAVSLKKYLEKNYNLEDLNFSLFPQNFENKNDFDNWQKIISLFKEYKNIKTCCFNNLKFHNQNCLAYYEIAIILSALNEYLQINTLPQNSFVIKTGVNSDYFIQIAKLRAIRRLWSVLKSEYNLEHELHIIIETGLTNKSISDKHNNLLRTTIESMAAVAGGCNELIVNEYDIFYNTKEKMSSRMAINQQLILKEESYLNKIADVSCGSYYIETITDALATKALHTFKKFENEGGFFKCLEKNIFSNEIKQQAKKRQELFNNFNELAVGVNKFKNEKEHISFSADELVELKKLPIANSILNFELDNFFK